MARHCYLHGHQYQIVDGRVVIVDEYTGRFLPDRSWEHGLHQAVEAKESLDITADRETLARLSFQRFFRMYPVLCGMTGTVADAKIEMERVYHRPITVIPTNRPVIREQYPARIFRTSDARWAAVVESILELHRQGRPMLVGSRSIQASELIASRLSARGIPHRVLNANFDKEEAELIALAGHEGAITVATNMAGRGTDIKPTRAASRPAGCTSCSPRCTRRSASTVSSSGAPAARETRARRRCSCRWRTSWSGCTRRDSPRRSGGCPRPTSSAARCARRRSRSSGTAQRRAERRARSSRGDVLRQDDWIDQHLPGR